MSRISLLSHYQILGIDRQATGDEVRAAYRRMARRYHPDRFEGGGDSQETMARINAAYEVLSDDGRRSEYDRVLDAEHAASAAERTRAGIAAQRLLGIPSWSWYLLLATMTVTVLVVGWLSLSTLAPRKPVMRVPEMAAQPGAQPAVPTTAQASTADSLPLVPARSIQPWTEPTRSAAPVNPETEPVLRLVREGSMKAPPSRKREGGMSSD